MKLLELPRLVLVAALAGFLGGCPLPDDTDRSGLVEIARAEGVRSNSGWGRNGLEYEIPGGEMTEVVTSLHGELSKRGWRPLTAHPDRDRTPTSFVGGGVCYESSPGRWLRHWSGAWIGRRGDVTTWFVRQRLTEPASPVQLGGHVIERRGSRAATVPIAAGEPNTGLSPECPPAAP